MVLVRVCVCRNCSEISAMSSVWVCLGNFYMGKRNKVMYPQHSLVIAQRVASVYKDQESGKNQSHLIQTNILEAWPEGIKSGRFLRLQSPVK